MADRNVGDLVARFRLIVDKNGTKDATLAIDKLERKLDTSSSTMASAGMRGGKGYGGGIAAGVTIAAAAVAKLTDRFLDMGAAGELTGEHKQNYLELDEATSELKDSVGDLATELTSDLAPALVSVVDFASAAVKKINELTDSSKGIGKVLNTLGKYATSDIDREFYDDLAGIDRSKAPSSGGDREKKRLADKRKASLEATNKVLEAQDKKFRSLVDAQIDEVEASLRVEGAALSLTGAELALAEAKEAVTKSSVRGAEFALAEADALEAVRDAQEALTDARFRALRATDDLGEAQAALAEAEFRFGTQSSEAGEAGDDLVEAQEALRNANHDVGEGVKDVARKQLDYQEALRDGVPTTKEAKEAAANLARAQLAVRQAQLDSIQAQTNYAEKQAKANGETQTGAQYAADLEAKLRSMAGYAGGGEFATAMTTAATSLANIRGGVPSHMGADGTGGALAQAAQKAGTVINVGPVYANDPVQAAAIINTEIDWASRGGGGGTVQHI